MAKTKTFILNLLAGGNLTLAQTEEKDNLVLFIIGKDKQFAIPFIKNEKATFAYVDPSIDDIDYNGIDNIIEEINKGKVFKDIFKYKTISKTSPIHSHTITGFVACNIPGAKMVQPKNLEEVASKFGYTIMSKSSGIKCRTRDYSEILKDEEILKNFKKDEEELQKVDASFDSLSKEAKIAYEAIEAGRSNGLILQGPTGTGKSVMARIMANKAGAPLLNLQITDGTTVEDLMGSYVPNSEGGFDFVEGPALKAYSGPYHLVVEEVNFGQTGVIACLNQITDDTPRIVYQGKTYYKHPDFVCYMTMNPGYDGTNPLNVALKNRFSKVDVPALTKDEFSKRAIAYSKGIGHSLSKEFFGRLFDFAAFIEKEANNNKWHENAKFSIRNAQRLCDAILLKPRNFEDFFAAISTQYLNDLSCDNDNSAKLMQFKKEPDLIEKVRSIYECYDLAETKKVEVEDDLESIFASIMTTEAEESSESEGEDDDADELMKKIMPSGSMRDFEM